MVVVVLVAVARAVRVDRTTLVRILSLLHNLYRNCNLRGYFLHLCSYYHSRRSSGSDFDFDFDTSRIHEVLPFVYLMFLAFFARIC